MAGLLMAAAIVLDDPAVCLAAVSLALFLAALAIRFRLRMARIAASVKLERAANRKIIPQGGTAVILTTFASTPEPGTAVSIREILPAGTSAGASAHVMPVSPDGSATLLYNLTALVSGTMAIQGIVLTVADPFFSGDLVMASAPFSGPAIDVYPHAAYERSRKRNDAATREKDKPAVARGYHVRSIREYLPGDDIRTVDWKMTAKYQRMFIREYTSVENIPPLVVLDIPAEEADVPDEALAALVNNANQETAAAIRRFGSVSLLVISGINVLSVLLEERNALRCTGAILDAAHPQVRLRHAYRWKNRAALHAVVRTCRRAVSREEGEVRHFHARIASVCRRSLAGPSVPVFAIQVASLLRSVNLSEIYLYSNFAGDDSHLRELASQARELQIRVIPRTVPAEAALPGTAPRELPGADPVQVIA